MTLPTDAVIGQADSLNLCWPAGSDLPWAPAAMTWLRSALPAGVYLALGPDRGVEDIPDQPDQAPARLRNTRRRAQFAAGRALARTALQAAGLEQPPRLPSQSSGAPEWPTGMVGAITHTDEVAAVAVARRVQLAGLGLDVERRRILSDGFEAHVCVGMERRDNTLDALARFSAKESIYKALAPLGIAPLRFHDVAVTAQDHALHFSATPQCRWRDSLSRLRGLWLSGPSHVLTLVWLGGPPPAPDEASRHQ
ncbi:4'-phosphopantetheinyl transferase family protein [Abyssibacter profundi]|uniref:4'-phosphopantetheinyl transferase N-terminal domain-containing protein n=1 Tax=Abyssibacter profundi TaxID=2182787 RepID=A0A363UQE1_9GAMM|nr:hypothetical protein [Abyssibacter profundi]MBV59906.1 hypothetical protein [Nevskiales bacterium]PWN57719.1 hypothetical protein DEH80_00840 [Abyssibacter profundi]